MTYLQKKIHQPPHRAIVYSTDFTNTYNHPSPERFRHKNPVFDGHVLIDLSSCHPLVDLIETNFSRGIILTFFSFSTLHIFYTSQFLHSKFSTPPFQHSVLSTLRIFYTRHSALGTQHVCPFRWKILSNEISCFIGHCPHYAGEICKLSIISTVRPTVHTIPSPKGSFSKTLFKLKEFKNASFSFSFRWKTFWKRSFSDNDVVLVTIVVMIWFPWPIEFYSSAWNISKMADDCCIIKLPRRSVNGRQ